jgi:hypothetical protein
MAALRRGSSKEIRLPVTGYNRNTAPVGRLRIP